MSVTTIQFVPDDPHFTPDTPAISAAGQYLKQAFPSSSPVEAMTRDGIDVFFPGDNLTSCSCPNCNSDIPSGVWQTILSADYDDTSGFMLLRQPMPCCGERLAVNELKFDWPVAFGKFALQITSPAFDTSNQDEAQRLARDLSPLLGCNLIAVVGRW
ncbi:MAG: hypothetical protein ABL894_03385 [Hyphomicrobium sp.]